MAASAGGQTVALIAGEAAEGGAALPEAPQPQVAERDRDAVTLVGAPVNVLKDQAAIWTSPARIRAHDLVWLVPLAAATGASIGTDHRAMTMVVSRDKSFNDANTNVSNGLVGGMIAAPVALLGVGAFSHDEHAREAGILGGEAMVDAAVAGEVLKLVTWRERPTADRGRGRFGQGAAGIDSSFPSTHSLLAWSSAAVIAGEYRSPWVQVGVYSLATGVSLTRVLGQQHFPSDVLVGSATGWLIGHYVYRRHHKIHMQ